ncbi:hypothetical protein TWF102_010507 [Orbilia oligospora]|uniref:Uncharacterized protein n=2 Tax=Orbilia oligospora TaxID=2813651 RepID=A0A7C8J1B0_ORBOL|nr:hypothetical protein TWF102_010507 [Orbilia oligospora]KAF3124009.1 hypothetical protein TWF594_002121 [Orbilia oligospora]
MESESFTGSWTDEQTAEASEKVLRRAKVSRMARQLQSRLALASYKTQRGWENLDLDTIEPRVDQDLMRKRMQSIQEGSPPHLHLINGSTNNHYDDNNDLNGNTMGGVLMGNNINNNSNNIRRRPGSGSSSSNTASPAHRKKRARTAAPFGDLTRGGSLYVQNNVEDQDIDVDMIYEPGARHSFRNHNKNRLAWKESHRLPQSSPGYHHYSHHHHHHSNSSFDMGSQPQFSFTNSPTRRGSPALEISHSRHHSHHYHQDYEHQPIFHSSPPRTPPHRTIPARPVFTTADEKLEERSNRGNNNSNNPNGNNNNGGKADGEGADLLLYLATSPSPNTITKANVSVAPSTPPAKGSAAALPSSMMNTPGGGGGLGGSGSFNFHDFVHITPSPAQGLWGNGGSGRTPMTMQARRRLNFDGLVPPSPMNGSQGSQGSQGKVTGLGMELGGELVSPTSGL